MISYVIFDMFETLVTLFTTEETYFGSDMAKDLLISPEDFKGPWHDSNDDRSMGKKTLEQVLTEIMTQLRAYDKDRLCKVVKKRKEYKKRSFDHMDPDVLPMLKGLKEAGVKVGLLSNCFSEERDLIHESEMYPFFDAPVLSFDVGLAKPDPAAFRLVMKRLADQNREEVDPKKYLYIGDGGSRELETARELSMLPAQACWYLKTNTAQPSGRKPEFMGFERPMDVVDFVRKQNGKGKIS